MSDDKPTAPPDPWQTIHVDGKLCVYRDGAEVFQAALALLRGVSAAVEGSATPEGLARVVISMDVAICALLKRTDG